MKEMNGEQVTYLINPPPEDRRCEVCGRHVSELKPFGGAGDPLVGDFTGVFLVKKFRSMAPPLTEKQLNHYREKHGDEAADIYLSAMSEVSARWECRDCIVLSTEEYFKFLKAKARRFKSERIEQTQIRESKW
jgi:rubredoxin